MNTREGQRMAILSNIEEQKQRIAELKAELAALESEPKMFICEYCGAEGVARRSDKRYCGNACRARASQQRQRKAQTT